MTSAVKNTAQLFAVILALAASTTLVWLWWHTPVYEVYVSFIIVSIAFPMCGWPRAEWLALRHVQGARDKLGDVPVSQAAGHKPVKELANRSQVADYFTSVVRAHETAELCREIRSALVLKGIVYAVMTMFFLAVLPPSQPLQALPADERTIETLKAWGAFSLFAMVAVLDLATCSLQRRRNLAVEGT